MIFLLVVLFLLLAACWLWLCIGVLKTGPRRVVGAVALQISFLALFFGFITAQPLGALVAALIPPLMLFVLHDWVQFDLYLSQIAQVAVPCGLVVFTVFMAFPRLRLWSIAPALLACLVAGIVVGERVSKREMCLKAKAIGIAEFSRNTLMWSLRNAPQESPMEIHAAAKVGDRRLGWSYRTMGWYGIPRSTWGDVETPVFDCDGWLP
jgi:hypothetical protein